MTKKILCLCLSGMLSLPIAAQQIVNNTDTETISNITQYIGQTNYLGAAQLVRWAQIDQFNKEELAYAKLLNDLHNSSQDPSIVINTFLERYPSSISKQKVNLILANIYLQEKDYNRALYVIENLDERGLSLTEKTQYQVQWAYTLMKKYPNRVTDVNSKESRHAKALLQSGTRGAEPWAETAYLYLGALEFVQGNSNTARNIFNNTHWSKNIEPEAGFYKVILAYTDKQYQQAISTAQTLLAQYPEMKSRPELISTVGQSYFMLNDYEQTINTLQSLRNITGYELTPGEGYALGTSYYNTKRYQESLMPLGVAADGDDLIAAISNLQRGNSLIYLGQNSDAILAFEAAGKKKGADTAVKEIALYNMALLQRSAGTSNFGQAVKNATAFLQEFPNSTKRETMGQILAEFFLTSKDYATSLQTINKINRPTESIVKAHQYVLTRMAEESGRNGNGFERMEYLNKAIALGNKSPHYGEALIMRSYANFRNQNFTAATDDARRYLQVTSSGGNQTDQAYYLLGYSEYNQGNYSEAYSAFSTYTTLNSITPKYKADALCRMADCKYRQKNLDEAEQLYNQANKLVPEGVDDAYYRLAGIYGLRKQYTRQINIIDEFLKDHPNSEVSPEMLYQRGRAAVMGHLAPQEAERSFKDVQNRYPDTKWARTAALDLALMYYNNGQTEQAIKTYKEVIRNYKQSDEARSALADLKTIYLESDRIGEYTAFVNSLGSEFAMSANENAHLAFLSAESKYRNKSGNPEQLLQNYLNQYPSSVDAPKAKLYLATLLNERGEYNKAFELYTQLTGPQIIPEIRTMALAKTGQMQVKNRKYDEALKSYEAYYSIATTSEEKQESALGLARSACEMKDYKKALKAINDLLGSDSNLSKHIAEEATLLRGRAHEGLKNNKNALADYKKAANDTDTPTGAEALVREASLLFAQGNRKESKKLIDQFIKQSTPQQYWLARGFVLLSDIYVKEGDKFTAKQYLESLKQNYNGQNAEIDAMINERLQKF